MISAWRRVCERWFGCTHYELSRLFRDEHGWYQRCLACGARVAYDGPLVPRRP